MRWEATHVANVMGRLRPVQVMLVMQATEIGAAFTEVEWRAMEHARLELGPDGWTLDDYHVQVELKPIEGIAEVSST